MALDAADALDPIRFGQDNHIHDFVMHPHRPLVCGALVDGSVQLFEYSSEGHKQLMCSKHHKDSARALCFSSSGSGLFTASKDCSMGVIDVNELKIVSHLPNAHNSPINVVQEYDDNILVTGDDVGELAIWDTREFRRPAALYKKQENSDFISDMCAVPDKDAMLVSSADGTLSVWDLRQRGTLTAMSDEVEDELLSVCVIKGGNKVVCGSQDGVLMLFSWGNFGDMDDRFPGHPESIDTLLVIDEDTVCTGSSDGLIRIVQIHPNKLLGVIGDHDEMPVEKIDLSFDKNLIGSCSHDGNIRFWDSGFLFEADDDEDSDAEMDITDNEQRIIQQGNFYDGL